MFSDAELYSSHHSMQVRDCNLLLDTILPKMSFTEEDVVMDMGCGTGDNTRELIYPRIPKLKKLIGVDVIPDMIEFARKHHANEKMEFHVADLEDESTLKALEGSISKAFSIHCFHWLKNQRKGFESLYSILKPGGGAGIMFVLSTPAWNCYPELINDQKWNKYLKDAETSVPESHRLNYRAEYYKQMFEDIGFEVLFCEDDYRTFTYKNDDDCKATFTSRSGLMSYIPEEERREFSEELFNGFMKYNPRNSEGKATIHITNLTVYMKKP